MNVRLLAFKFAYRLELNLVRSFIKFSVVFTRIMSDWSTGFGLFLKIGWWFISCIRFMKSLLIVGNWNMIKYNQSNPIKINGNNDLCPTRWIDSDASSSKESYLSSFRVSIIVFFLYIYWIHITDWIIAERTVNNRRHLLDTNGNCNEIFGPRFKDWFIRSFSPVLNNENFYEKESNYDSRSRCRGC